MAVGLVVAVLAVALSAPTASLAAAEVEVSGDRLANPGAEQGAQPDGWGPDGFAVLGYGQDRRVPALAYADRRRLGGRLFAARRAGRP